MHRVGAQYAAPLLCQSIIRSSISAFGRVNLTKELRQQGKTSVTVYAVSIDSKEDVSPIEIDAPRDYNESRRLAEQMAKFIQLPIMDNSTGKEIIRELDQLDETIKQKVERKGETVIDITPPPMMKSNATIEYGVLKAVIPPRGINPISFLVLIPVALFDLFVFFQVILPAIHDGVWPIVGLTVFFFIIVPVIVVLIKFSPDARTTYHVEASRDKLTVEVKKTFGKKTYEIPAHELEELELSEFLLPTNVASRMGGDEDKAQGTVNFITKFLSGPEITARSDRTSISFGRGLEREELEYIHSAIKKIMTE